MKFISIFCSFSMVKIKIKCLDQDHKRNRARIPPCGHQIITHFSISYSFLDMSLISRLIYHSHCRRTLHTIYSNTLEMIL